MNEQAVAYAVPQRPLADEVRRQRVAALLLTIPDWTHNYTSTLNDADWLIAEAYRVGWTLIIEPKESE